MRHILTNELLASVPELLEQGLRPPEIAKRFGCTTGTLAVKCSKAKISLRKGGPRQPRPQQPPIDTTLKVSRDLVDRLRERAAAMGRSGAKLASELLEAIVRDDLFDAVLDEKE
jgi:hypothetical protein